MSARVFCIPGLVFLFCAFVLSLLVTISTPGLPALEITRTTFRNGTVSVSGASSNIDELRFGIWAYCIYEGGGRTCIDPGHGYSVSAVSNSQIETVGSGWTRGLAVNPVATAVAGLAFLCSLSTHITLMLVASILSFLAALLTLITFAIEIALFVEVHNKMNNFSALIVKTHPGPGFWITLVVFILLLISGCTVCFGRRRERMAGAKVAPVEDPQRPGLLARIFRRRGAATY